MRRFAVIGLGEFGVSVAKTLAEEGGEVIAIDKREDRLKEVMDDVAQAVQIDATDEKAMKAVGIEEVDAAVVGMGRNLQASILTTIILKDFGVKEIVAKAVNAIHGKVLEKIGVSRVVYPELDMGVRVARSLFSTRILEQIELSSRHSIMEIQAPPKFIGKTLRELDVRARYGVNVIAIKRKLGHITDKGEISHIDDVDISPHPDDVINKDDTLLVFGDNESIAKLRLQG
jgi:trk system potassium uptake protein TrkA